MKKGFPSFQLRDRHGWCVGRDGLVLTLFIRREHLGIAPAIWTSLQNYLHSVPAGALQWYVSDDGDMVELDEKGWEHTRQQVVGPQWKGSRRIELRESPSDSGAYLVNYHGHSLRALIRYEPAVPLSFTFPTEYLLERGTAHLHALAIKLSQALPFSFGYASLAVIGDNGDWFSADWAQLDVLLNRYAGLDLYDVDRTSLRIGDRSLGAHWLTFLGQPLLGQLGGIEALRQALPFPDVTLLPLEGDRLIISLAETPDPLDTEQGPIPPQYRALARLLEPFMYEYQGDDGTQRYLNRWRRRLL
jgi:hypothetical protein